MSASRHEWWARRAGRVLLAAPLAALAAVASLPGCGAIGLSTSASVPDDFVGEAGAGYDAGGAQLSPAEGGIAQVTSHQAGGTTDASVAIADAGKLVASPLCGASASDGGLGACDPDEVWSCEGSGTGSGSGVPRDGGSLPDAAYASGDGGVGSTRGGNSACHVTSVPGEGGASAVAATCSAAGTGGSGWSCAASSDCMPGLDCVVESPAATSDAAVATGVCRRYCCSNVCADSPQAYCQKELTVGGSVMVPVCVPSPVLSSTDGGADGGAAACQLLNDATCTYGLTCQVVPQSSGQVQCVMPGTATAGQSCETVNCQAGLSCLGVFPMRTCAQLCDQDEDTCPSGQTCTSNAVLSNIDPQIGVCAE